MSEPTGKVLSGREMLLKLEAENKYVFHGSESPDIDKLEPRQAYNYNDGRQEPDGNPAVFASSKADYAILMALMNKKNCPNGFHSSAGTETDKDGKSILRLRVKKDTFSQLTDTSTGFVYIFNKESFKQRDEGGVEYTSNVPVNSENKVMVTKADLPPYVEVFE